MVTYVLFFILPVDRSRFVRRTEVNEQDIKRALHIDGPVYKQYGQFVGRVMLHGSLGRSFNNREDVNKIVKDAAPITASLVVGGALLWMLIALPIGVLSAIRPRSLLDRAGMLFVLVGISSHPVWVGLILSYFLGFKLGLFPITGYCDLINPSTGCGGPVQWAYHLLLPWFTFAILFAALYVRMIRATVLETLDEDYVRTAQAKGASSWQVLRSHVLRNALLPVMTMAGMDVARLVFPGVLFIEAVYGMPGLGGQIVIALRRQDLPTIVGITAWITVAILFLNVLIDVVYAWVDPRIRLDGIDRPR
jgi:peptide/nickel transport system permease protein